MPRNIEKWKHAKHTWYLKNKHITHSKSNERRREKLVVFNDFKKQFPCCICGENEPVVIDFHHMVPSENDVPVNRVFDMTLRMEAVIEEIKKCIPLCSNCHRLYHHGTSGRAIELQKKVDLIITKRITRNPELPTAENLMCCV